MVQEAHDTWREGPAEARASIGPYRVLRTLGSGGQATVFEVARESDGARFALKLLAGSLTPGDVARLRREAQAAQAINHPAIVQVHAVEQTAEGEPFLLMELLEGEPLSARLERATVPPSHALRLLVEMAAAVGAAHELGIVHRDLKPGNVFLLRSGRGATLKVMDFGIAKLQGWDATKLTATGSIVGTPQYMAPEQIMGAEQLGPAADVYALGVIAYRMLTGRSPFLGAAAEILLQHLSAPVPEEPLRAVASPGLAEVVLRALAKDPRARPANAGELAAAFRAERERVEQESVRHAAPPPPIWQRRRRSLLAGAGLVAILAILGASPLGLLLRLQLAGWSGQEGRRGGYRLALERFEEVHASTAAMRRVAGLLASTRPPTGSADYDTGFTVAPGRWREKEGYFSLHLAHAERGAAWGQVEVDGGGLKAFRGFHYANRLVLIADERIFDVLFTDAGAVVQGLGPEGQRLRAARGEP